jgi:hypothetical protein
MGISHLVPFARPYATSVEVPLGDPSLAVARADKGVQADHESSRVPSNELCRDIESSGSYDTNCQSLSATQGPERLIIDGPGCDLL